MIKAHFENKKLIIDISGMDEKYKEMGKKIKFTLYYGTEYTGSNGGESYSIQAEKEIEYSGENEVILYIDEVKNGYRGNSIFVGYYIDINFGKKLLIFKDSKEINISGRDEIVFHSKNLEKNPKYTSIKDEFSYKKIFKNLSQIKKIFLALFFIAPEVGAYLFFIKGEDYGIGIIIFGIIAFLILFFTSGRGYFKGRINKDIKDGDDLYNLTKGKINLDLEELQIQLFAYNSEKGNYKVRSGTTTRTVWFNTQVGNVLLFEDNYKDIKAGTNIENLLKGKLYFSEIYKKLFPSIKITNHMGLFLNLELRIISKNYKDITLKQEINLDKEKFISKNLKNNIQNTNINISEKIENKISEKNNSQENDNLNSDFFG